MECPALNDMNEEQRKLFLYRLSLEEQQWKLRQQLSKLNGCEHFIIKGHILFSPAKNQIVWTHEGLSDDWNGGSFSATCAVCGHDFGWWCPKSPTHYCEYDESNIYECKWCGEPDERK